MTYSKRRSHLKGLLTGATDGKYIKARPDTEVDPMNAGGDALMKANRQSLNPLDNYQTVEYPSPVIPGGTH